MEIAKKWSLPIMLPSQHKIGCAATIYNSIAIDAEGYFYKCLEEVGEPEYAFGHYSAPSIFKEENLKPWISFNPSNLRDFNCKNCVAFPICGICPREIIKNKKIKCRSTYLLLSKILEKYAVYKNNKYILLSQ